MRHGSIQFFSDILHTHTLYTGPTAKKTVTDPKVDKRELKH